MHILCYGITPDDHDWLQAHAGDVEVVASYLHEHEITCALAHPFYAVEAPLLPRHRRRLAQLFAIWEVRNGSRASELNQPAAIYVETHGGIGVGGSDDHAGVDIGRTWTQTPLAATPDEFLAHVRAGRVSAHGEQGSAAKWAHAAMALAIRALGRGRDARAPDPAAVLRMVERVMTEGDARAGTIGCDLGPEDAQALLRAWLDAVDLAPERARPARPPPVRRLLARRPRAPRAPLPRAAPAGARWRPRSPTRRSSRRPPRRSSTACFAAIPYAPATAFLGREKRKLATRENEPVRVALVADGIGGMHGVTHTIDEIRERGVPGFEVEVIGTDPHVDRRLSAVAEVEMPFYAGPEDRRPEPAGRRRDAGRGPLRRRCTCARPGPAGVAAAMIGRVMGLPIAGSYHTELAAYAGLRSGDDGLAAGVELVLGAFYGGCDTVLSPRASPTRGCTRSASSPSGSGAGIAASTSTASRPHCAPARPTDASACSTPAASRARRASTCSPTRSSPRGRATRGWSSCSRAAAPRRSALRARLGAAATFLGWLEGDALARPTRTPTSSSSARRRTPSARWCSRRRPPGSRSWRSTPAGRRS